MPGFGIRSAVCVGAASLCVGLALSSAVARADVSFKGKTVRMIVGSPPGGGTDLGARLFARFLGKYLPGSPVIGVQNIPGAGGIKVMNYMVQQVAPDGLTLIAGSSSQIAPDVILKNKAVAYDPTKFEFIGGVAATGTVTVANKEAMARMEKTGTPIVVAQVGGVRTGAQMALFAAEYLGWKIKWVSGYQGTAALTLAVLKGEADLTDTAGLANLRPLIEDSRFAAVVQAGIYVGGKLTRRNEFPNTPTISELVQPKLKTDLEREAFASWERTIQLGKFFALPPNTPKEYVEVYRKAYQKLNDDAEFRKAAVAQLDDDYQLMTAEESQEVVDALARTPDRDLEFLIHLRVKYGLPADEEKKDKSKKNKS
jgi:tripartite-type tricarboxylate transporter receptor subunit TctC